MHLNDLSYRFEYGKYLEDDNTYVVGPSDRNIDFKVRPM